MKKTATITIAFIISVLTFVHSVGNHPREPFCPECMFLRLAALFCALAGIVLSGIHRIAFKKKVEQMPSTESKTTGHSDNFYYKFIVRTVEKVGENFRVTVTLQEFNNTPEDFEFSVSGCTSKCVKFKIYNTSKLLDFDDVHNLVEQCEFEWNSVLPRSASFLV